MISSQKGEGRIGCLFVILLAVALGYVGFKIIPVYIDKMNFEEDLGREASKAGANFWTDEKVKQDILLMARFRNFQMGESDITITRSRVLGGEVKIDTKYTVPVDFPGYHYTFKFEAKASSLVGTL
ncbi:MAG TPA: hypothetical protein VGK99_15115 [Acidobacteriota bacterium]|jgi:hypothetical protein